MVGWECPTKLREASGHDPEAVHAEWAFLSLPGRPLTDKLAFLFEPTSLGLAAVASVVLGTTAFVVGYVFRKAVEYVREAQ